MSDSHASSIYESQSSFILGFHGCDEKVGQDILMNPDQHLNHSNEDHDWLGPGAYFWEGNARRAWEWALDRQRRGKISKPFVLGAVIDLGRCLDLFDRSSTVQLQQAHNTLLDAFKQANIPMPANRGNTQEKLLRNLDCAVIRALHQMREQSGLPAYDSLRGAFLEGDEVYPGAGFRSHTHIQLCVRNSHCIKGYFKPLGLHKFEELT